MVFIVLICCHTQRFESAKMVRGFYTAMQMVWAYLCASIANLRIMLSVLCAPDGCLLRCCNYYLFANISDLNDMITSNNAQTT